MSGTPRGAKGNPAHKRMGNEKLKSKRARSWKAGQERKEARRKAQDARERTNRERKATGSMTPWELAQALRRARREQERKEAA